MPENEKSSPALVLIRSASMLIDICFGYLKEGNDFSPDKIGPIKLVFLCLAPLLVILRESRLNKEEAKIIIQVLDTALDSFPLSEEKLKEIQLNEIHEILAGIKALKAEAEKELALA